MVEMLLMYDNYNAHYLNVLHIKKLKIKIIKKPLTCLAPRSWSAGLRAASSEVIGRKSHC